jgi:hypothetical protein
VAADTGVLRPDNHPASTPQPPLSILADTGIDKEPGMDTKTRRQPRTNERRDTAPTARRARGALLTALALALLVSAALIVAVLRSAEPVATQPPPPGVSPVQLERWGTGESSRKLDHEHQNRRPVGPEGPNDRAAEPDHELQRFRNAVDVNRS